MDIALTRGSLRLLQGTALCVAALGASGCGTVGYDSSLSAAQIRFVDVSPGSPEMDFYVNGSGAAYSVGYANFTSYLPVTPGAASIGAHRGGTGLAVATAEMNLTGGRQYTAVLSHGLGNVQERIYLDQDTPAPAGQVALRVLNEIEGAGAVSMYVSPSSSAGPVGAPVSVLSVASGGASAYANVPVAASYTVTATVAEGALNVPVASVMVKAGAGAVRTVVFSGTSQVRVKDVVGFVLDDADAP